MREGKAPTIYCDSPAQLEKSLSDKEELVRYPTWNQDTNFTVLLFVSCPFIFVEGNKYF